MLDAGLSSSSLKSVDTIQITLSVAEPIQELIIAELADSTVDGFLQDADELKLFISEEHWTPEFQDLLRDLCVKHGIRAQWHVESIPDQNWNLSWEKSIQPILVPPFLVRPSWSRPEGEYPACIDLVIDPKMSFGTGHHESTRMCLAHLAALTRPPERVLDIGTGTGILAIAAVKMGAMSALGIDIDEWSRANANENIELNDVQDCIEIRLGSVESVSESGFQLVLANVNRHVILSELHEYVSRTAPRGTIILAGLQKPDRDRVIDRLQELGCSVSDEKEEGEWWSIRCNVT